MQIIKTLKAFFRVGILIPVFVFITVCVNAGSNNYLLYESLPDSTKMLDRKIEKSDRKEERKKKKAEGKRLLKETHSRFLLSYDYVFANLKTRVTFSGPNGILNLSLSLEDNLGLSSMASFSSLAFVYRITRRSGLYANYYGINRNKTFTSQKELIFLGDTIPAGSSVTTYFNTQIASAGYVFSALSNPDAYLGFYVNIYVIFLKTGFDAKNRSRRADLEYTMPLPNIGFIGTFRLTKWLLFNGSLGVFSLNTKYYGGIIYDLSLSLGFQPTTWMALNLTYKEFSIEIYDNINKKIDAIVEYNFKGPAIGLTFKF
jgi:hypothetical protein